MRALFATRTRSTAGARQAESEAFGGRARRLRPRRAESAIRHRPVVPPRLQARAVRGNRDRDNVACAMGRGPDRRSRSPQRAKECVRMADDDLKEKTAILDARFLCGDEKHLRRARQAAGRRRPQSQPGQVLPHQARRNPRAPRQVRRFDLPARAANQGRRRRPARSAHRAVAGQGQIQSPFARGVGAEGRHHRARSGRSDRGARLSLARAQLAALPERAPFRSAHLRDQERIAPMLGFKPERDWPPARP